LLPLVGWLAWRLAL